MSKLKVSIINNNFDTLRYVKAVTEAQVVLYELLKNTEEIVNEYGVNDLKGKIEGLEEELRLQNESWKKLFNFFDNINGAYNDRLGNSKNYNPDDEQFLEEIVAIIKQNA